MASLHAAQALLPVTQVATVVEAPTVHLFAAQLLALPKPAGPSGPLVSMSVAQTLDAPAPWSCIGSLGPVTRAPVSRTLPIDAEVRALIAPA